MLIDRNLIRFLSKWACALATSFFFNPSALAQNTLPGRPVPAAQKRRFKRNRKAVYRDVKLPSGLKNTKLCTVIVPSGEVTLRKDVPCDQIESI